MGPYHTPSKEHMYTKDQRGSNWQLVNPKQAGLFADWYGLCNFWLNGPIDLKFGM